MKELNKSKNSPWKRILELMVLVIAVALVNITMAAAVPYQVGDVFAGTGNGMIDVYNSTGVFIQTLDTTSGSREQTGMCFDALGNLYATSFTNRTMSKFNNSGSLLVHPWGGPFSNYPESCVVDASGNIYTGEVDGTETLRKFDANGNLLGTWNPLTTYRGIDWIDLAADQKTIYYTSEGTKVMRYDVSTSTQLSDFATGLARPCFALRIRNNGEVMVACSSQVYRLNASGNVMQTYLSGSGEYLFALNLDPDGTSFWTGGYSTGNIYKIDINTGTTLTTFTAPPRGGSMAGLAIFGEPTAGKPQYNVEKDFRHTNVDFVPYVEDVQQQAELGDLLPDADGNGLYEVRYVTKTKKDGTVSVSSTNPGQLYGVINITGAGITNVSVNDTFGSQFDVNPDHLGGGIEVIRVNATTGLAKVITDTIQVTDWSVNNTLNQVRVVINLTSSLKADENLMVYVKFKTALKHSAPEWWDFVNTAEVIINEESPVEVNATVEFY